MKLLEGATNLCQATIGDWIALLKNVLSSRILSHFIPNILKTNYFGFSSYILFIRWAVPQKPGLVCISQELRCEFRSQSQNLQVHKESYMPVYQCGCKYTGIYGYVWLN